VRSLRGRLTLGITLVLAAVLLVAGSLAERDVDEDQRAAVDDRLKRTAELSRATALSAVDKELPPDDERLKAVLSATRTSVRLTLQGAELFRSGDAPPRRAELPEGFSTFEAGGVTYRAYSTTLPESELGARLELTTRLTQLEQRRERLRERLLILGGLALLVTFAGVFALSSLVLRPLRRLQEITASVAADEDLSRRVPPDQGPSELRALARSFNAMLARLGRSSEERERALAATRRFAADAGHELRTPLTSAQTTLSTLARHPDLPAERRVAMARDAQESHRRLVTLLDGLQLLARGDAAAPHVTVDLADLAHRALAEASGRHPGVRFDSEISDTPVYVKGWEPGLLSLLDNLLENAVRHGVPGDHVRICLDGRTLTVEDAGPGIDPALRERLFEPFERGDHPERPGSGLGLAIVSQQAAHHGATIDVEHSADLGGARFVVRFP
jgi:signal transduction histidine kinase